MGLGFVFFPTRIQSPKLRMIMEPKYYAEVIGHPNHHLRISLDSYGLFPLSFSIYIESIFESRLRVIFHRDISISPTVSKATFESMIEPGFPMV